MVAPQRRPGSPGSRRVLTPIQSLSGRYELLGRLGVGGMAEVFLARAVGLEEFEKIVVLKRVLPDHVKDHQYTVMFRDEARVAATLEHPNIVHTHDIGVTDDECFFTMEYLHGEDLKAILDAASKIKEKLPLELALQIAVGCAAGLHHAHEQTDYAGHPLNIVHRDVSPANVIVTRQSGVKLIDFGIAKAASGKEQTRVGVLKGKVAYMSPEQCRGQAIDRRSDVFALGIVLYEMITMKRPFPGANALETVHKVLEEEPTAPCKIRLSCPAPLERIVLKALQKDPAARYQSAFEMQEELELVTRDCQLLALPGGLGRYLQHLFGTKPHPWTQHAKLKRPPTMPRWVWTELDSTLATTRADHPRLVGETVGFAGIPHIVDEGSLSSIATDDTQLKEGLVTVKIPSPPSQPGASAVPATPAPERSPDIAGTGTIAINLSTPPWPPTPVHVAATASPTPTPSAPVLITPRRDAIKYILLGGLVGSTIALLGFILWVRLQ